MESMNRLREDLMETSRIGRNHIMTRITKSLRIMISIVISGKEMLQDLRTLDMALIFQEQKKMNFSG